MNSTNQQHHLIALGRFLITVLTVLGMEESGTADVYFSTKVRILYSSPMLYLSVGRSEQNRQDIKLVLRAESGKISSAVLQAFFLLSCS